MAAFTHKGEVTAERPKGTCCLPHTVPTSGKRGSGSRGGRPEGGGRARGNTGLSEPHFPELDLSSTVLRGYMR